MSNTPTCRSRRFTPPFPNYYDHKDEVDALIKEWDREYERMRAQAGESPFVTRMRAEGRLP